MMVKKNEGRMGEWRMGIEGKMLDGIRIDGRIDRWKYK